MVIKLSESKLTPSLETVMTWELETHF
jgi:hypothetical protein